MKKCRDNQLVFAVEDNSRVKNSRANRVSVNALNLCLYRTLF